MELLAPAGSKLSLIAAVENGANAVYLGGKAFNARNFASNFDDQTLEWAIDYCHIRGVKLYVTVNILIHEHEINSVLEYVRTLYNQGVDAIIVQDLGLAKLVSECLPELEVHASTQMFIHNAQSIEALKKLGIKRIVLARELGVEQIQEIAAAGIEVEVFIHGALCISYSGQCLLSSLLGGRSGNRGQCAQPCRLPYQLVDFSNGRAIGNQLGDYLLSPKDLNLVRQLNRLETAGVASLKIEGRMKGPEYVAVVTKVYRDALDSKRIDGKALYSVFNREFTTHHLLKKQGRELIRWKSEPPTKDADLLSAARQSFCSSKTIRKIKADLFAQLKLEERLELTLIDELGSIVYSQSQTASEPAKNRPLTKETLQDQLLRLGNSPIEISSLEIELDENVMLPFSQINQARQQLISYWEKQRINDLERLPIDQQLLSKRKRDIQKGHKTNQKTIKQDPLLAVTVTDIEAAITAIQAGADLIYYFGNIYTHAHNYMADLSKLTTLAHQYGVSVYASFERVTTSKEIPDILSILDSYHYDGVLVGNLGLWYELKHKNIEKPIHGDWSFNIFNQFSASFLASHMTGIFVSPELRLSEIKKIAANIRQDIGVLVHGRLPAMVSEYCAVGACMNCKLDGGTVPFPCERGKFGLRDRKGYILPVELDHRCRMHIFNPVELCMIDHLDKIIKAGIQIIRIEAKARDLKWIDQVVTAYAAKIKGSDITEADLLDSSDTGEYTKGHYFRGVK